MLRKESSRTLRLMSFEIGSLVVPSKWLFPRYMDSSLDELGNLRDPVRSFLRRSRIDKKGMTREGMVQEK